MDSNPSMVFDEHPELAIWEVSRACDVACLHCRAAAQTRRSSLELTTFEGYDLIEQFAELKPASFLLTGGDPLKRPDIFELIDFANRRGLRPSLTPSATPLLTREAIETLKSAGLFSISMSLDGPTAVMHDGIRGIPGAWDRTVEAIRHAVAIGLSVDVNSTITKLNRQQIDDLLRLCDELSVASWNILLLVPTGRASVEEMIEAEDAAAVFDRLYDASRTASFEIGAIEATHYRRHVVQRHLRENPDLEAEAVVDGRVADWPAVHRSLAKQREADIASGALRNAVTRGPARGARARGTVFVSHIGEVYPSAFLPLSAGNIRHRKLPNIYRSSPLFMTLRDASQLKGKCGMCEFKEGCGGSRARAYAVTGDPMGEEPLCAYQPIALREREDAAGGWHDHTW